MNLKKLNAIFSNRRSIRRFKQKQIPRSFLRNCIDHVRLCPSGMNLQPVEYIVVTEKKLRRSLFSCLHLAGYLDSTWSPANDEQPMAYIVLIVENNNSSLTAYDVGIAMAHIVLYAEGQNIGSCIIQNIEKQKITDLLDIPQSYVIEGIIALGYKKEHPILETDEKNIQYWLDEDNVLHVPKKPLDSIYHNQKYS